MIVDIHTHIFPKAIAKAALDVLIKNSKHMYAPVTNMTKDSLLANMDKWGIDMSVVQPIVTKPSQFLSVNNWAKKISCDRVLSFGGIYPTEKYKQDIDYVVELGLKGLKFHPEYQDFVVDDHKMLKIYEYALSKGLVLFFHGGYDPIGKFPYKSSPQRFAKIIDSMQGGKIAIAHLGGQQQWDDVERYLVGKNVYFDTSMGCKFYPLEQFVRIVRNHGSERVLFASDSPWSNAKEEIEIINSLDLTEQEKANILGNAAMELLS